EEGRLAPCVQRVEALFRFAGRPRVERMHVDAEGAPVDLRRAQLQQVHELVIQSAVGEVLLERQHRLVGFLAELPVVEAGFHRTILYNPRMSRAGLWRLWRMSFALIAAALAILPV